MESQEKDIAFIIQYNQKVRARPIPFGKTGEEVVYYPELNEDGFAILKGPKAMARLLCAAHPDRYRLWRTPALDAQRFNPNGALEWIKIYPWDYKKIMRIEIDPENGEQNKVYSYEWFEDRTGISLLRKDTPKPEEKPGVGVAPPPNSQKGVLDQLKEKAEKAGKLEAVEEYVVDFRVKIDKPKGMFSTDEFPELVKGIEKIIEE